MSIGPHYLDKKSAVEILRHHLPHWKQDKKMEFVTFRLADSLPQHFLEELKEYRQTFYALNPEPRDPKAFLEFTKKINAKFEFWLNQGYGECVLRHPNVRQKLIEAFNFIDGNRCLLLAYIIMPNHVHLLMIPFPNEDSAKVLGSARQFSANRINKLLGKKGALWQQEPYDKIVRGDDHLKHCIRYIEENPRHLRADEYTLYINWPLINKIFWNIDCTENLGN